MDDLFKPEIISLLTSRFSNESKIRIGKKLKVAINYIPKENLLQINRNIIKAKELLYVFLHQFNHQIYHFLKDEELIAKKINTNVYYKIFGRNYKNQKLTSVIIKVLEQGTEKGSIIELSKEYCASVHSREYQLSKRYLGYGFEKITLTTKLAIKKNKKIKALAIQFIQGNKIALNDIMAYSILKLVNTDLIKDYAEDIISNTTFIKGEVLTLERLETHLEIFDYLSDPDEYLQGFLIPKISKFGRVYTSFNLMPKWIREMYSLIEVDYSALHPNIASAIFEEDNEYRQTITHQKIADYLKLSTVKIKKLHLSFFNESINNMYLPKYKGLMDYYNTYHPTLIPNIIADKKLNGYKNTSHLLQQFESKMQVLNIEKLNNKGINPLYIFDALAVENRFADIVKDIMNETASEMKVFTDANIQDNQYLKFS